MDRSKEGASAVLIPLFFLSGISALIYQVVWLKYLGFVFGNTVHAAATLIAIFLAGLGIGAFIFSRIAQNRSPLLVYALVEAVIGAFAAFSPNFFRLLDTLYIASYQNFLDAPAALTIARILCASLFLLPPTILMGGTLPLLVRAFAIDGERKGHEVSSLYAANTFGATAGVALAGFFAIPAFGLLRTVFIGILINFGLALGTALWGFTAARRQAEDLEEAAPIGMTGSRGKATAILVATFLMGFTAIADEVFWSRILVLHLGSSVYAYSLMLFAFLIGLAIGSAVIDRFITRIDAARLLGFVEIALGVVLALQIFYFVKFVDVLEAFARLYGSASYSATLLSLLSATLTAILLPTALMGASFPLTVRLFNEATGDPSSRSVGAVYLFNTIGSIIGSFLAGFILIRVVGSQNGLLLMALINVALGIYFLARNQRRTAIAWGVPAALLVIVAGVLAKKDQVILSAGLFVDDKAEVLLFREDVTATVTLRRFSPEYLSLELNGVNVAGTSPDLIGTQKLQGHLPLMMHPNPKSVLHIGFGSGGTAHAVSTHPVENITIAEISPEVLETSHRFLGQVNHGVLNDKRVRASINDGRNYVLAAPEKFDVILSDSIHPRYAGNGSLYTEDYFELCKKKLNPNGVVSMWLPFYSLTPKNYFEIVRAFRNVFPNTTIWYVPNAPNSFTIVIGRLEPGPLPIDRLQQRFSPSVRRELDEIGIRDVYDLASALIIDAEGAEAVTRRVDPHIDDRPTVEYESGRIINRNLSWYFNFGILTRSMTPLRRAFSGPIDEQRLAAVELVRAQRANAHLAFLRHALGLENR